MNRRMGSQRPRRRTRLGSRGAAKSQPITDDELFDTIAGAQRSVRRWEHQVAYDEPGEAEMMAEWRAGGAGHPPADHPWVDVLARFRAIGCPLIRVRVQDDPITEYQAFLAHVAEQWNVPVGEEVRVMTRRRANLIGPLLSAPRRDWWLIDGRRLIVLAFDHGGHRVATDLHDGGLAAARARAGWGLAVRVSSPALPSTEAPWRGHGGRRTVASSEEPQCL